MWPLSSWYTVLHSKQKSSEENFNQSRTMMCKYFIVLNYAACMGISEWVKMWKLWKHEALVAMNVYATISKQTKHCLRACLCPKTTSYKVHRLSVRFYLNPGVFLLLGTRRAVLEKFCFWDSLFTSSQSKPGRWVGREMAPPTFFRPDVIVACVFYEWKNPTSEGNSNSGKRRTDILSPESRRTNR